MNEEEYRAAVAAVINRCAAQGVEAGESDIDEIRDISMDHASWMASEATESGATACDGPCCGGGAR